MRNLRTRLTRSRRARRVSLAMIILAATPAFADHPQGHSLRMMPLLPLQSISSNSIHNNPFCGPELQLQDTSIQLTSGSKSVQLKPIDGAIGLHAIKKSEAAHGALIVEPAAQPVVRSNPLVESKHHENKELIETRVLDSDETPVSAETVSTVSGENPKPTQSPFKAAASRNSSIVLVEPTRKMHAAPAESPVAKVQVDSESVEAEPKMEPVKTEPVLFSLSDHDDSKAENTPPEAGASELGVSESATNEGGTCESGSCESGDKACPETSQSCQGNSQATCDPETSDSEAERVTVLPEPVTLPSFGDAPMLSEAPEKKTHHDSAFAQPLAASDSIRESSLPAPIIELPADEVAQTRPEAELDLPAASQPVEMSLSGSDASIKSNLKPQPEVAVAEPIILARPVRSVTVAPAPPVTEAQPAIAAVPPAFTEARPAFTEAQPAITAAQPAAIYRSGSATAKLKDAPTAKLHDQRFRPPVSVTSVPISINRNEADVAPSASPATVEQVEEVSLARPAKQPKPKMVVASNTKLTPLFMKSAQVRSLTVAGELKNVRIGDKGVCQAVASGPNQLKLIGTGTGVTQLVVWAQTDDPNQPMRMRAFEVHVDQVDPAVQAGGSTARLLNESIRDAFPGCRVTFSQNGGELIVRGECDTEASAEKIIRMIRKTCLVPVQDQLVVR